MRQPAIVRLRRAARLRHGEVEDVLLDAGEIEPPRDDAGATRRRGEGRHGIGRPADRQMVVAARLAPRRWPMRRLRRARGRRPRRFGGRSSGSGGGVGGRRGSLSQG